LCDEGTAAMKVSSHVENKEAKLGMKLVFAPILVQKLVPSPIIFICSYLILVMSLIPYSAKPDLLTSKLRIYLELNSQYHKVLLFFFDEIIELLIIKLLKMILINEKIIIT
jgi:hypothetical protein